MSKPFKHISPRDPMPISQLVKITNLLPAAWPAVPIPTFDDRKFVAESPTCDFARFVYLMNNAPPSIDSGRRWSSEILVAELESMSMLDRSSSQTWANMPAGVRPMVTSGSNVTSMTQRQISQGVGGFSGSLLESAGQYDCTNSSRDSAASDEAQGGSDFLLGTGSLDMMMGRSTRLDAQRNPSALGPNRSLDIGSRSSSRSISKEMPPESTLSDGSPRPGRDCSKQQRGIGQGYRKLFQQVTKVGRGQKLGDNLTPEVTVRGAQSSHGTACMAYWRTSAWGHNPDPGICFLHCTYCTYFPRLKIWSVL